MTIVGSGGVGGSVGGCGCRPTEHHERIYRRKRASELSEGRTVVGVFDYTRMLPSAVSIDGLQEEHKDLVEWEDRCNDSTRAM